MPSSPKFLVASRSERPSDFHEEAPSPSPVERRGLGWRLPRRLRWGRRDDVGLDELRIEISVSYRTLLVIFSIFVVLQRIVDVIIDTV
jgi:hypothetical protein